MKTTNERFINIQLFAEPEGASTPNTNTQDIDYESEYRKMVAERDSYKAEAEKQKGLKDKYASENADYKKKELDKIKGYKKISAKIIDGVKTEICDPSKGLYQACIKKADSLSDSESLAPLYLRLSQAEEGRL